MLISGSSLMNMLISNIANQYGGKIAGKHTSLQI